MRKKLLRYYFYFTELLFTKKVFINEVNAVDSLQFDFYANWFFVKLFM
jgi:hypothetical protein